MKKYFKYKWHSLNLNVDCTKCGNNIVLQEFEGFPECNECGNTNKISWSNILQDVDIEGMRRGDSSMKKMLGIIDASVTLEPAEKIHCYHCKATLEISEEEDLKNYSCSACKKSLIFKEFEEIKDIVFYKNGSESKSQEAAKMIAVRCVSCGAPLEVDPTKTNFNCKFCATENILPMSLRYKVVLDDIFVGERKSRFPKLLVFERDGKIVKQALNENGKASFADAELDRVLIEKMNDVGIYNIITNNFKYLPPDKVLNEMFSKSTNQEMIKMTGLRLQKSTAEIDDRIQEVNPKYKENKKKAEAHFEKREKKNKLKKLFGNTAFRFIAISIVIILIIILAYNKVL